MTATATAQTGELVLSLELNMVLLLDPAHESKPRLDLYLSNHVCNTVHTVLLPYDRQRAKDPRWKVELNELRFPISINHSLDSFPLRVGGQVLEHLFETCNLNVDVFSSTRNDNKEPCLQRAGCFLIPLASLVSVLLSGRGTVRGDVAMPHVYQTDMRIKGSYEISISRTATRGGVLWNGVALRSDVLSIADAERYVKRLSRTHERNSRIMNGYMKAAQFLYDQIKPTWPSVDRINNVEWRTRTAILPSLPYAIDPTLPVVSNAYYENALAIVLSRMNLSREKLAQALRFDKPAERDLDTAGSVAAQILCLFVHHGMYRRDQVYAPSKYVDDVTGQTKIRFEDLGTEDMGDCDVDEGASGKSSSC